MQETIHLYSWQNVAAYEAWVTMEEGTLITEGRKGKHSAIVS